jgi:hypothetical protein
MSPYYVFFFIIVHKKGERKNQKSYGTTANLSDTSITRITPLKHMSYFNTPTAPKLSAEWKVITE